MPRLPLIVPTEPRDALSLDKDSLLQNCFIDSDPNTSYVVKRPGMILSEEVTTAITNKGIFYNPGDNNLYFINDLDVLVEIVI